jgi:hypothetical protein
MKGIAARCRYETVFVFRQGQGFDFLTLDTVIGPTILLEFWEEIDPYSKNLLGRV